MSLVRNLKIQLIFPHLSRLASSNASQSVNKFGDSTMPDKLYKTIELELKSSEPAVLKSYEYFVKTAAGHLDINIGNVWSQIRPSRDRWTVLKSIHIYRKHMVQYEIRTYFTWIHFHKLTGSTADTLLEYIQRMLPEGVALKVTKIGIEPIPSHLTREATDEK